MTNERVLTHNFLNVNVPLFVGWRNKIKEPKNASSIENVAQNVIVNFFEGGR
jgi:hypothetical protein